MIPDKPSSFITKSKEYYSKKLFKNQSQANSE